ncbi:Sensor histidine kinase LiaS [Corynebacterium caspium DSM 44850]|nr:Sensor histidine kinase LiaS [Corynebacterium caspium DSM 44850]
MSRQDDRTFAALVSAIDVLSGVLLLVIAFMSRNLPHTMAIMNLVLCAAYAIAHFYGSRRWSEWPEIAQWGWLTVLSMLWILMLPVTPIAIYLILPMFFVFLLVFNDFRGIIAVVLTTIVAIFIQIPAGLTPGGVLGPSLSALIIVGVYGAFRRLWQVSEERQQLIMELRDTRSQLAASEHAAGMAAERQRIAHEIHDTVAQGLSSIQMLIHAASRDLEATGLSPEKRAPVEERMTQVRRIAADNLAEARAMIAALQPASLSETSFEGALKRVAESFGASADMDIDVVVDGEVFPLPMKVEATLLRVAQGAVGNVMKHAKASKARISVNYSAGEVRVDVVDNGQGFDPVAVVNKPAGLGHVGLDAMRRRSQEIGGEFTIESNPGAGTAVSVAVPIIAENAE